MDEVFGIAKEYFSLVVSSPSHLIQKRSGDVILSSKLRHLAVDALTLPSELDKVDTGVRL